MKIKEIIIPQGKIRDYIDGKLRKDTPEEYVRQNIEKRLHKELGFEKSQLKIEFPIKIGSANCRLDIAIFDKSTTTFSSECVKTIIECKKENIDPSDKKEGIEQLKSYMSACLNCEWGMWTNGLTRYVIRKVKKIDGTLGYDDYLDLPMANGSIDKVERPKRSELREPIDGNLLLTFRNCHNYIYSNDGMKKEDAFFEFLKLIYCKIYDENNDFKPLEFYVTQKELNSPDGQLIAKKRISDIFEKVKKKYPLIFSPTDKLQLSPRCLSYVVSSTQKYSFITTHFDIKGKAYEELVGANLRGDRGQYFTPRNVMKMAIEMINPQKGEKFLDPSCGTGGSLITAMEYVIKNYLIECESSIGEVYDNWTHSQIATFENKLCEIAEDFFGLDIDPSLVKATIMNIMLHNDQAKNMNAFRTNTLLPPHEWDLEFKKQFLSALKTDISLINTNNLALFDVIFSNPPFGSKIQVKDPNILSQFDLAYIWEKSENGWSKTDKLQQSVPPEQLFIERCIQFLKPGGRMAIVIPDSILGSPGLEYLRYWIISKAYVIASIDLPSDTFQPRNGTQTSVLILQKKTEENILNELENGFIDDYDIFMAIINNIGHDKRGNIIYKKDINGNTLYHTVESTYKEIDNNGNEVTVLKKEERPIINDGSIFIPEKFSEWKKGHDILW